MSEATTNEVVTPIKKKKPATTTRKRRTAEELIAQHEAEIARLKADNVTKTQLRIVSLEAEAKKIQESMDDLASKRTAVLNEITVLTNRLADAGLVQGS